MITRTLLLGLWLVAAIAAGVHVSKRPAPTSFAPQRALPVGFANEAQFSERFVTAADATAHVHAASLIELTDGRLQAVWFAGSREGGPDVTIQSAVFVPATGQWRDERSIATRAGTEKAALRGTRKLGNPIIGRHSDGRLWVFYVSVAIGGWAGSSINAMYSADEGATWSRPERLITSPFFNLSTLVRTSPVLGADGTMLVPVYHQFIGKFGEVLRIDRHGTLLDKQRLSWGRDMLQPVLLPYSASDALVLLRTGGSDLPDRVSATRTVDAGRHWSPPTTIDLPNPDSALAGVVLRDGRMLVALNDSESDRDVLSIALSTDTGRTWRIIKRLEDERAAIALTADPAKYAARAGDNARRQMCVGRTRCGFEFSYPNLIETRSGDIHIVYTWNRAAIKHVAMNRAALEQAIKSAGDASRP